MQKNQTLSQLPGNLVFSLGVLRETHEQAPQHPFWKVTSAQVVVSPLAAARLKVYLLWLTAVPTVNVKCTGYLH